MRSRYGGGARADKERRRWLPEYRAADCEAHGRRTFAGCGEPALDRGDVSGLSENDLTALRLLGDRAIDRARAVGRGRAFNLPELWGQPAAVRLADEVGQHRRTAYGVERVLGLLPSRHEDLDDQLSSGATAPCLKRVQLLPLSFADFVGVVGSKTDQDLDERAEEGPLERLRRPRKRKRAGLLGGSSDHQTVAACVSDDFGRVLSVQQQRTDF